MVGRCGGGSSCRALLILLLDGSFVIFRLSYLVVEGLQTPVCQLSVLNSGIYYPLRYYERLHRLFAGAPVSSCGLPLVPLSYLRLSVSDPGMQSACVRVQLVVLLELRRGLRLLSVSLSSPGAWAVHIGRDPTLLHFDLQT